MVICPRWSIVMLLLNIVSQFLLRVRVFLWPLKQKICDLRLSYIYLEWCRIVRLNLDSEIRQRQS